MKNEKFNPEVLKTIYCEYHDNFDSVEEFAECYELNTNVAKAIIESSERYAVSEIIRLQTEESKIIHKIKKLKHSENVLSRSDINLIGVLKLELKAVQEVAESFYDR